MGVTGLWSLLRTVKQPVDLESLEGSILAIDISIWLNQSLKSGNTSINNYLHTLFFRLCKLLHFKIKPVFVFDGVAPSLKKIALDKRRQQRFNSQESASKYRQKLLQNYIMKEAIKRNVIKKRKPKRKIPVEEDSEKLFQLADIGRIHEISSSSEESSLEEGSGSLNDLAEDFISNFTSPNDIYIDSEEFKSLPNEVQHEVVQELIDQGKQNSWSKVSDMPKDSREFSQYQFDRMMKKSRLTKCLEDIRHEINSRDTSLVTANILLGRQASEVVASRIVSEDSGHVILIKGLKKDHSTAQLEAMEEEEAAAKSEMDLETSDKGEPDYEKLGDLEFESESFGQGDDEEISEIRRASRKLGGSAGMSYPVVSFGDETLINKLDENQPSTSSSRGFVVVEIVSSSSDSDDFEDVPDLQPSSVIDLTDDDIPEISHFPTSSFAIQSQVIQSSTTPSTSQSQVIQSSTTPSTSQSQEIQSSTTPSTSQSQVIQFSTTPSTSQSQVIQSSTTPSTSQSQVIQSSTTSSISQSEITHITEELKPEADEKLAPYLTSEELSSVAKDPTSWMSLLDRENEILERATRRHETATTTVTEQCIVDAQELLSLFGVPFITSPQEAEAQCAYLDQLGLVDGTITEDSDVWLFGGRKVYKNFFNQRESVEYYSHNKIEEHLGLTRERMIGLALLCGSDYTEGVANVGPITAMEVLAEFPGETALESLDSFSSWWNKMKQDKSAFFKASSVREKLLKLHIPKGFPEKSVEQAYLSPIVDESKELFSWGKPDLDLIRNYAKLKFGWQQSKVDHLLLPVILKLSESKTQSKITCFFPRSPDKKAPSPLKVSQNQDLPTAFQSKRLKCALHKLHSSPQKTKNTKAVESSEQSTSVSIRKRKKRSAGSKRGSQVVGNQRRRKKQPQTQLTKQTTIRQPLLEEINLSEVSSLESDEDVDDFIRCVDTEHLS